MQTLSVDIWSDIACPWCFVGKRRLEAALERFSARDEVRITWHAFELDPAAPPRSDSGPYAERLARKYGTSVEGARGMIQRMVNVGLHEGIHFDFERIQPGNTFDAHRVIQLARARGLQDAIEERFFRAYLCEGEAIGVASVLPGLAAEAGLDVEQVAAVLASDDYAAEVRADEEQARALGITGVPFFVFSEKYAVSGAQPPELLLRVLEKISEERAREPELAEGATCGPDGC